MGTHLDNLLLLFLLRLFAAPGLSLFLGGHCGDRCNRPDLSEDGYRREIWHLGRWRKTRPPSPPQRTESESLIRRRNAAFATGRCRRALWVAKNGARKRSCACAFAACGLERAWRDVGKCLCVTRDTGPFLGRGCWRMKMSKGVGFLRVCAPSAPFFSDVDDS